jgi:hypothetical protein
MKTFTAFAAAALVTFTLTTGTANAQMAGLAAAKAPAAQAGQDLVHKTGRRRNGGKIAAGIALGIIGAAAIASQSHRYYRDSYESRHERRCRRWMYSCDNGSYHACRQFDRRC